MDSGFANAQGGRIYIGKDDVGNVVDVEDYKTIKDEIPQKIKDNLGITAEVNLLQEGDKHYIEIIVSRIPYLFRCVAGIITVAEM